MIQLSKNENKQQIVIIIFAICIWYASMFPMPVEAGGVKMSEGYAKAIDEMMNRIKGGQPVLKPRGKNLRRVREKM